MNTQIQQALEKAGVKTKPIAERLWLWLRDNPEHTAKEIAAAIGETPQHTSSCIHDLFRRREMLVVVQKRDRRTGRLVGMWSVKYPHKPYELLPTKKKNKTKSVVVTSNVVPMVEAAPKKQIGRPKKLDAGTHAIKVSEENLNSIRIIQTHLQEQLGVTLTQNQILTIVLSKYLKNQVV